jgi:hypothetical protein
VHESKARDLQRHSELGFAFCTQLPFTFSSSRLFVLLSPKDQKWLRYHYELAEFVHNLYVSLLEADFTDHDIHFLNYQARSFFERHGKDDPDMLTTSKNCSKKFLYT